MADLEIDEEWLELWRSISLLKRYLALAEIGIFDELGTIIVQLCDPTVTITSYCQLAMVSETLGVRA